MTLEERDNIINNIYRLMVVQAEALSVLGSEFLRQCQAYAEGGKIVHERKKAFNNLTTKIGEMQKMLDKMTENSFQYCDENLVMQTADNLLENGRELARWQAKWAGITSQEKADEIERMMDENNVGFVPKSITDKWRLQ